MKLLKSALLGSLTALCMLLTSGCNPLLSKQPLGEKPVVLNPKEIDGTWVSNGGSLQLLVTDAAKGLAMAAWIEIEDKKDLKMEKMNVAVRQTGDTVFVNVLSATDSNYVAMVGKLKLSENTMIFWGGAEKPLQEAGRKGRLLFSDTNRLVVATNFLKAAEFLASPEGAAMFDLTEPIVLTRMPR